MGTGTKSPAVSVRDKQLDPPPSYTHPTRSHDKAPPPSAPPSLAHPVRLTPAPASPTCRSGQPTCPARATTHPAHATTHPACATTCPTHSCDKAQAPSASASLAHPVCLTSASASPTCCSSHLTCPATLALPAQPTPTAQSLSPPPDRVMSEEDVFNHLFMKTTQGENGKTNLKGKGKANLNNTEQGPKVCLSIWMLISC